MHEWYSTKNSKEKKRLLLMSDRSTPDIYFLCPTSLQSHYLKQPFPAALFAYPPLPSPVASSSLRVSLPSLPSQPLKTHKHKSYLEHETKQTHVLHKHYYKKSTEKSKIMPLQLKIMKAIM